MSLRLSEVAALVGLEVVRDAAFENLAFASRPLPDMLGFAGSARFAGELTDLDETVAVIATRELAAGIPVRLGLALADDPQLAFATLHNRLATGTPFYWDDFETEIHPSASIHPRAWVSPRNARLGPEVVVGPGACVGPRVVLGPRVEVRAGVILEAEGLQQVRRGDRIVSMLHRGGLELREGVVVHAGAVLSTGLFRQTTVIGPESRIGNLAFVSHNVVTGPACTVGHGAVINGNARLGARVWIGPNATVSNHVTIGDDAFVCLGATVVGPVGPGERVLGVGVANDMSRRLPPGRGGQ